MLTVCMDQVFNHNNASGTMFLAGSTLGCETPACLQQHGLCLLIVVQSPWGRGQGWENRLCIALWEWTGTWRPSWTFSHVSLPELGPLPIPQPVSVTPRWIGSLLECIQFSRLHRYYSERKGEMDVQDLNTIFTVNSWSFCCCCWVLVKFHTFKNSI